MARRVKELAVKELTGKLAGLREHGCVLVGFTGVKAHDSTNVRRLLSSRDARMVVVKNALFALALEQLGARGLEDLMDGPTAVVTSSDPISAVKAAREAASSFQGLRVLGGYAEGRVLGAEQVEKLASLPGREVLLAQVAGCMTAPAQRFASCLVGAIHRLVSVLDQLRRQREQEEPGTQA